MRENVKLAEILLVEDNPADIELTRHVFETAGLCNTLRVAMNGRIAIEYIFNERRPDLILLDLNIPGLDGHEVMKALRDDEQAARIPIIVLTGGEIELEIAKRCGVQASQFIAKPLALNTLLNCVRALGFFKLGLICSKRPLPAVSLL